MPDRELGHAAGSLVFSPLENFVLNYHGVNGSASAVFRGVLSAFATAP